MRRYALVALLPLVLAAVSLMAEFGTDENELGWTLAAFLLTLPFWILWAVMVFAHWFAFGRTRREYNESGPKSG